MTSHNTHNYATHFPRRSNLHVENMSFSADVDRNGKVRMELGVLPAADADGIVAAKSIATALDGETASIIADHRDNMGAYGRALTIVLSGAGTPAVTVHGLDYLGQPMSETFAGNGTTPVAGKKAFKEVTSFDSALVAATTINIGYGNVLGLPYAVGAITEEYVDGVAPTAGTKVVAVLTDPQTATTGDPRGSYTPHASFVPNGARDIVLVGYAIEGDYHGIPHYAA